MHYAVKMRAERDARHISGAERIVGASDVDSAVSSLVERARSHPNGSPDTITVTVQELCRPLLRIPPLPVSEPAITCPEEARAFLAQELSAMGLATAEKIVTLLYTVRAMRGAVLLNVDTMERMEPDKQRGVRATCMDYEGNAGGPKNHFREALCLASKVSACPCILGELCISDDEHYTTGYFASRSRGYVRIANIKEAGTDFGGRVFLFKGTSADVPACIDYLESQPVLVEGFPGRDNAF